MKTLKQFFCLLTSCMLAFGFTACEKDGPAEGAIWDFSPINFYFTLTGENGEDLLNPATPGSYAGLNITATYEDKTYEKDVFEDNKVPYSRAYFAHLFGIYTTQLEDGRYALCFGELDGADTYNANTDAYLAELSALDMPKVRFNIELSGKSGDDETNHPVINVKKTAFDYSPIMEWDVTPLTFSIFLHNKNGYDLLNSFVDNYVYNDSVKAIFQGKEYYLNKKPENRAILPDFTGLTRPWHDQNDTRAYPIYFGELDGTETFENEMLIMDWSTLGRDTITFTSKMEWKNGKPTFIRRYRLNGEEVDKDTARPIIRIVKDIE